MVILLGDDYTPGEETCAQTFTAGTAEKYSSPCRGSNVPSLVESLIARGIPTMLGPQENVTLVVRETLNILLSQLLSTKQPGVYPLPPRQIS